MTAQRLRGWWAARCHRGTDLAADWFQLRLMLNARLSLSDALELLEPLSHSRSQRQLWRTVRLRVNAGDAFSTALGRHSRVFDAQTLALIRAGEVSGELPGCIEQLERDLTRQLRVRRRLQSVLTYPLFALLVLLGVLFFLLGFVVPGLSAFVEYAGAAWHTRTLLWLSSSVRLMSAETGLLVVGLLAILCLFVRLTPSGQRLLDAIWLKIPIVGDIVRDYQLSTMLGSLGTLYGAGIPLVHALSISVRVPNNRALQQSLASCPFMLERGDALASALARCPHVSPAMQRLLQVGESSGALTLALRQCAEQLQASADVRTQQLEALIGPALLCLLGGILMWIVVSILGPVYESMLRVGDL